MSIPVEETTPKTQFALESEFMDLKEMLTIEFNKINDRFAQIDDRFTELSNEMITRFEASDARFDKLEAKMDTRFDKVDAKFEVFMKMHEDMMKQIVGIKADSIHHEHRITKIETVAQAA